MPVQIPQMNTIPGCIDKISACKLAHLASRDLGRDGLILVEHMLVPCGLLTFQYAYGFSCKIASQ
jgi:hypothetical protein